MHKFMEEIRKKCWVGGGDFLLLEEKNYCVILEWHERDRPFYPKEIGYVNLTIVETDGDLHDSTYNLEP